MTYRIPAFFFFLLLLTPVALADHEYRRGYHASPYQWARHYAETAIRQVRQNRRQHCGYYGQRWSPHYDDHFYWAMRVSRGQSNAEINRRDRDLRHCLARRGHYRPYGHDERYYWRDYRHDRYGHRRHDRWHKRQDDRAYRRHDERGHRDDRHDRRHDGRDDRRGRRDRDRDDRRGG